MMTNHIQRLPHTLFFEILGYLEARTIFNLQETCKMHSQACEYVKTKRKIFSHRIKAQIEMLIDRIEDDYFRSNFPFNPEVDLQAKKQAVIRLLRGEMEDMEMVISGSFPLSVIDEFSPNDIDIFIKIPFVDKQVELKGLPEWSFTLTCCDDPHSELHAQPKASYAFLTTEYAVGTIFLFSEGYTSDELKNPYSEGLRGQMNGYDRISNMQDEPSMRMYSRGMSVNLVYLREETHTSDWETYLLDSLLFGVCRCTYKAKSNSFRTCHRSEIRDKKTWIQSILPKVMTCETNDAIKRMKAKYERRGYEILPDVDEC